MAAFVTPKVYLIGETGFNQDGLNAYLTDSGNAEFIESIQKAKEGGLSDLEILCSLYAKLCYKSLSLGHNKNIDRIRDIDSNIRNCFDVGHGSVFEHSWLNFVASDVSRVFTHELVRHRVGTAYSQNSMRYIRTDHINLVLDPILEPVKDKVLKALADLESVYASLEDHYDIKKTDDFARKKKVTSALRRILPDGIANEIGFSLNVRSMRHIIELRTDRHAEWEIRQVFGQVYEIVKQKYPILLHGAQSEVVDDLLEVKFKN
jgi:thymidylate synthase (FAD)